jgi:hypothetical protein
MLFNLFRRSQDTGTRPPVDGRVRSRDAGPQRTNFFDSDFDAPPLPEVKEGNGPEDWALWEDSVAAFEQSFEPAAFARRSRSDPPQDAPPREVDAYARVRKHDP